MFLYNSNNNKAINIILYGVASAHKDRTGYCQIIFKYVKI